MSIESIRERLDRGVESYAGIAIFPVSTREIRHLLDVAEAAQMFMELEGGHQTRYGSGWYALVEALAALEEEKPPPPKTLDVPKPQPQP